MQRIFVTTEHYLKVIPLRVYSVFLMLHIASERFHHPAESPSHHSDRSFHMGVLPGLSILIKIFDRSPSCTTA